MEARPGHGAILARQPILDRKEELVGYELMFQAADGAALAAGQRAGSAAELCAAYGELGMYGAFGHNRAFLRIEPDFIHEDAIELLPPDGVVLELASATLPDETTLARCRTLRERHYSLALADYRGLDERSRPLLALVDFVKIETRDQDTARIAELAGALRRLPIRLLAEGVDSRAQMESCRDAGFELFQGHYFARPEIVSGRRLPASQAGLIRLIQLTGHDAETAEIEDAFKREPALTLNLLRIVNAVGSGFAQHIGTLRHALALLGRRQLQRWLQLLLMAPAGGTTDPTRAPLLQVAALRGRMMELLAASELPNDRRSADHAFIAGIMSMMPAALALPMDEILDQIAPAPEVRQALAAHAGTLGRLLALLEAFDAGDSVGCSAALAGLSGRIDGATLNGALVDALRWINGSEAG